MFRRYSHNLHGALQQNFKYIYINTKERCYGMEMNVEKNKRNENFKATIPSKSYDRSKTTGECGIF